jgi:sulfotransferase family protein
VLPNFLVIGAMKAGTDSLHQYLRRHPQVFMAEVKELDYFAEELNWTRGRDWYERQFEPARRALAIGEASTSYSKYPTHTGVPGRMASLLPDVRLIYIVRHPVERMRSQYLHEVLMGSEREPIERALLTKSRYLDYSRYALQVSQYLKHFSADHLLMITSESLRHSRKDTLRRVSSFLGIDPFSEEDALLHEFHRTAEKRVARPFIRRLQRSGAYRALSALVPPGVKNRSRPLITRGIDPRKGSISDAVRRELEMSLRDDLASLREVMEPEFDCWGILDPADRRGSS